jgi:hypothetical protein
MSKQNPSKSEHLRQVADHFPSSCRQHMLYIKIPTRFPYPYRARMRMAYTNAISSLRTCRIFPIAKRDQRNHSITVLGAAHRQTRIHFIPSLSSKDPLMALVEARSNSFLTNTGITQWLITPRRKFSTTNRIRNLIVLICHQSIDIAPQIPKRGSLSVAELRICVKTRSMKSVICIASNRFLHYAFPGFSSVSICHTT